MDDEKKKTEGDHNEWTHATGQDKLEVKPRKPTLPTETDKDKDFTQPTSN